MVTVNQEFLNLNVCESKECDFSDVEKVNTPQPSDRWNPIAHDALVKEFRSAVDNNPSKPLASIGPARFRKAALEVEIECQWER